MIELDDKELKVIKEFKKSIINIVNDVINNKITGIEDSINDIFKNGIDDLKSDSYINYCVLVNQALILKNLIEDLKIKL